MLPLVRWILRGRRERRNGADRRKTGNIQGNVIQFEPTTSEHISARTIDQISITAIAPAADCRTFAIGFVYFSSPPLVFLCHEANTEIGTKTGRSWSRRSSPSSPSCTT